VASLQSGWQRGRETDPAAQTTDGTQTATADERDERRDAELPQNGEA
jgi:hypothetical protein